MQSMQLARIAFRGEVIGSAIVNGDRQVGREALEAHGSDSTASWAIRQRRSTQANQTPINASTAPTISIT